MCPRWIGTFLKTEHFWLFVTLFKRAAKLLLWNFLATGEGAFHFQELTQNAAGEGIDLSDSESMAEFQIEVLEAMDENNI